MVMNSREKTNTRPFELDIHRLFNNISQIFTTDTYTKKVAYFSLLVILVIALLIAIAVI